MSAAQMGELTGYFFISLLLAGVWKIICKIIPPLRRQVGLSYGIAIALTFIPPLLFIASSSPKSNIALATIGSSLCAALLFCQYKCTKINPIKNDLNNGNRPIIFVGIVAFFFILFGLYSFFDIVSGIMEGKININFGVVTIFIGFGVLFHINIFRILALTFIWGFFIVCPLSVLYFIFHYTNQNDLMASILILLVIFAISLWQYRVLTSPDVCDLFQTSHSPKQALKPTPPRGGGA